LVDSCGKAGNPLKLNVFSSHLSAPQKMHASSHAIPLTTCIHEDGLRLMNVSLEIEKEMALQLKERNQNYLRRLRHRQWQ
jgi:hypothetical protein